MLQSATAPLFRFADLFKSREIFVFVIDFISEALEHVEARTGVFEPEITSASFICQINCWRFSERYLRAVIFCV